MLQWIVKAHESGTKLIVFLTSCLEGRYSSRYLKRVIEHNGCQINQRTERFASTILGEGDAIQLQLEYAPEVKPVVFEAQRVLYEDDLLLVYDKPAGINSDEKGIVALLTPHAKNLHLVHRLDRDTTGVIMLAKQRAALEHLMKQFKQHLVQKRYLAIVDGILHQSQGIIENRLGKKRHYAGQTIWGAVQPPQGLYAYTEWRCVQNGRNAALVECFPKTGRTHQIRVHLGEMGHPILGDFQYGSDFQCSYRPKRCLLHASSLLCNHPATGLELEFSAPLPEDFKKVI